LERIKVVVADDNSRVLSRTVSLLLAADFEVVGTAGDGRELIDQVQRLRPDVVVLDLAMPVLGGIDAFRELREAGSKVRCIFFSVQDRAEFVRTCMEEGALGFVTKMRLTSDLVPAIHEALSGRRFVSPSLAS